MNSRLFRRYSDRFKYFQSLIILFIFVILSKFVFIQVIFPNSYQASIIEKTTILKTDYGIRGNILDRNNNILASSTYQYKIWTNNIDYDINKEEIFIFLTKYFDTTRDEYESIISNKSRHLVLKDKITKNIYNITKVIVFFNYYPI